MVPNREKHHDIYLILLLLCLIHGLVTMCRLTQRFWTSFVYMCMYFMIGVYGLFIELVNMT